MTKKEKIEKFNPNSVAVGDQVFGLPFSYEESDLVILPVPWEVTVSYKTGTAATPIHIKDASKQVDLYDAYNEGVWKRGIFFLKLNKKLVEMNAFARPLAEEHLNMLYEERVDNNLLDQVNHYCDVMVNTVEQISARLLKEKKKVILLGGDHSTPLGYIKSLISEYKSFGILQIDAHFDLRNAYEGFKYSHASIMHNVLKNKEIVGLTQIGIRDYCEEEKLYVEENSDRIDVFYDRDLKRERFEGVNWKTQCEKIVNTLPDKVYISFDIDGMDPKYCPNTGTPVVGGFEMEEILYLLEMVKESGRQIIGMDLNEVSAKNEEAWDANVAAQLLYKLSAILLK